jgi:hypothetical protein
MSPTRNNDQQVEQDPPLFQLMSEVGILAPLSQNSATRLLAPEQNMSQFIVLNHFARLGQEASLSRLARAMEVAKGAMTNTVSHLEKRATSRSDPTRMTVAASSQNSLRPGAPRAIAQSPAWARCLLS